MKNICGSIAILLTVISFAATRSLPNNHVTGGDLHTTGKNWRLTQREADSASQTDNVDPMVNKFTAEISNLSIPDYLKHLFINLTYSKEMVDLSESTTVNTIRSYENQAKSKLPIYINTLASVSSHIALKASN